jgi:hypothetical protein
MEKHQEFFEKASKSIHIADHMLTMTYPLVQDPKLLMIVMDNIYRGLLNSVTSLLYFERYHKRIPPFNDDDNSKLNMFKLKCADRLKISNEYLKIVSEIKEVIDENEESPMSVTRKDKFVICSEDYKLKTLSVPQIKVYLEKAKLFIEETSTIITQNERSFRGR